jgi:hypothetical protein
MFESSGNKGGMSAALGNIGLIYLDFKNYNKAIELASDDPETFNLRGVLKNTMLDYDGAIADYNRANKLPYTMNQTLDIQWQPRNDLVIQVGYVGNLGRHEVVPLPFNQARIASPTHPIHPGTPFEQDYTYGYSILSDPSTFTPANLPNGQPYLQTFEGGNVNLRVPYIGYSSESESYTAAGISAYHALQAHVEKRLSHGVQVGFSYTYSHATDEQSAMGLFYNGNNPNGILQTVTAVSGQTLTFSSGDAFNLNGRTASETAGTIKQLQNLTGGVPNGTYPPTSATRVWMVTYYLNATTDPAHPMLMRAVNFNTPQPVAETVENLQFAFNFADGTSPAPVNQFAVPTVPVPTGDNENQIRSVNVYMGARSTSAASNPGKYVRSNVATRTSVAATSCGATATATTISSTASATPSGGRARTSPRRRWRTWSRSLSGMVR